MGKQAAMDADMEFGKLDEAVSREQLRPDRNRHFAVASCGTPRADDLPIFVDVDAMRDMEEHALSDARVELGGVMLGGQYRDEAGRPFVVVTDSLRAEHYESTRGSFKFTHDTWAEITRQRDEFPPSLQMVGWYHTHPDWGVFLSGLDLFICESFFGKPLDVALVIDPCRRDRGWFQWKGGTGQGVRQVAGFYLIASRFRSRELEVFAAQLEDKLAMTHEPRLAAAAASSTPAAPSWQGAAALGLLAAQSILLALIAWRMLAFPAVGPATPHTAADAGLLQQRIEQEKLDAQAELLDRVFQELKDAPPGAVSLLMEQKQRAEELTAAIRGHAALERQLERKNADLQQSLQNAEGQRRSLQEELDALKAARRELVAANRDQAGQIAALQRQLEPTRDEDAAPEEPLDEESGRWYAIALGAAGAAALLLAAAAAAVYWRNRADRGDEDDEDDAQETND